MKTHFIWKVSQVDNLSVFFLREKGGTFAKPSRKMATAHTLWFLRASWPVIAESGFSE